VVRFEPFVVHLPNSTYGKSEGIRFGVNFTASCGTEIVAIADGIVSTVDGPIGSPLHNLMIDHPQVDYASTYGHLLEMPQLMSGQQVKQGQVAGSVLKCGAIAMGILNCTWRFETWGMCESTIR
jgi:murein DD-endopeptidase MepM/ murein hydrolase activator NlpD